MMWLHLLACQQGSSDVPVVDVSTGTFKVPMSVPGRITPVEETIVRTPEFDTRLEIAFLADHGSKVEEGDRLVVFDESELLTRIKKAQDELELAQTKILQNKAKLQISVSDAEADIERARLDLKLAEMRRTDSEAVPLVEREEARVSETKSKMAIDSAESSLTSVKFESSTARQLLRLEVEQKQRNLAELEEQLGQTTILAPKDGVVLVLGNWQGRFTVGRKPWGGQKLISLPELGDMKVEAEVHEVDSPRVALGQRATIILDAFPERIATGKVEKVADLAVPKGKDELLKVLEIEVSLDETWPEMLPGLSARTELILDEVEDALWVPAEAVFEDDDGTYVWASGLTGFTSTRVEVGTRSDTHVVIESGLVEGDRVALVDPTTEEKRPAAE